MRDTGRDGRVRNARPPRGAKKRYSPGEHPAREEVRESEEPLKGTVSAVYAEKGYGFLQGEDGKQRFFHTTACVTDLRNLRPGDEVSFIPTSGSKGPRAIEVRKEG